MVKKKVLAVGDRVGVATSEYYDSYGDNATTGKLRYDPDNSPDYGEIVSILADDKVMVKWDSDWMNEHNKPVDVSTLLPEADIKTLLTKLEQEFNDVEKQIKEKLKEASKAVKEAQKLAKKTGRDLADMYDAVYPLRNAMDSAGWHSSSWGC